MILVNATKLHFPTPLKLSLRDKQRMTLLQIRSTIMLGSDPNGWKPLEEAELDEYRNFCGRKWAAAAPRWNGVDFPFAPYGEKGCAYDLPEYIARFLATKYNEGVRHLCEFETDELLHCLRDNEELPKGITPIRPYIGDPMDQTSDGLMSRGQFVTRGRGAVAPQININDVVMEAAVAIGNRIVYSPFAQATTKAEAAA